MVFESTEHWPSKEGDERKIPPPLSSYGFQKLAVEYFAKAAWDQYKLPYTIVRPFNCVGIGEGRALGDVEVASGNVKLAMSHVVPDLVQKIVKGQDPLHILGEGNQVRHYTYGGDLASGIVECMSQDAAYNDDFNISTAESTTVRELAEVIWRKIKGDAPLTLVSDPAYEYDVQKRVPDVHEGQGRARLRVHHLARRDARRGHPVGHPGGRRRSSLETIVGDSPSHGRQRRRDGRTAFRSRLRITSACGNRTFAGTMSMIRKPAGSQVSWRNLVGAAAHP